MEPTMVRTPRPLVAGNWKMNGLRASAAEFRRIVQGAQQLPAVDVMVCPPATLLALFAAAVEGSSVGIGARCAAPPPRCSVLLRRRSRARPCVLAHRIVTPRLAERSQAIFRLKCSRTRVR